jgi:hypothetical protein
MDLRWKFGMRSSSAGLKPFLENSSFLARTAKVQNGHFSNLLETALPQESQWIIMVLGGNKWLAPANIRKPGSGAERSRVQKMIENSFFDQS